MAFHWGQFRGQRDRTVCCRVRQTGEQASGAACLGAVSCHILGQQEADRGPEEDVRPSFVTSNDRQAVQGMHNALT